MTQTQVEVISAKEAMESLKVAKDSLGKTEKNLKLTLDSLKKHVPLDTDNKTSLEGLLSTLKGQVDAIDKKMSDIKNDVKTKLGKESVSVKKEEIDGIMRAAKLVVDDAPLLVDDVQELLKKNMPFKAKALGYVKQAYAETKDLSKEFAKKAWKSRLVRVPVYLSTGLVALSAVSKVGTETYKFGKKQVNNASDAALDVFINYEKRIDNLLEKNPEKVEAIRKIIIEGESKGLDDQKIYYNIKNKVRRLKEE